MDAPSERHAAFAATCRELGVRCVLIELARGAHAAQPMTSSQHCGPLGEILGEVEMLHAHLRTAGFPVVRVKLELELDDSELAARASGPGTYFEFHGKLWLSDGTDLESVEALCVANGAHLSRNAHEHGDRGSARFVTLRVYDADRDLARRSFAAVVARLAEAGHTIASTRAELTIHDDRMELDRGWLP